MLIDTHAHSYLEQFDEDRAEMIAAAQSAGVKKILLPNIDKKSIEGMFKMVEEYPDTCYPMMGLHPCDVKLDFKEELIWVEQYLNERDDIIALGEIGIDLYWDKTFIVEQVAALEHQILLAKKFKLPIVLHCRDSFEEVLEVVEALNDDDLTGVFHCFTGTVEDAQKVIDLEGFYLGIGGVSTFKNGGLDTVLPSIDLKYLLLETDAPYLAPAPYRGKRNESSFIPIIANRIAELKGLSLGEVEAQTTINAMHLFSLV